MSNSPVGTTTAAVATTTISTIATGTAVPSAVPTTVPPTNSTIATSTTVPSTVPTTVTTTSSTPGGWACRCQETDGFGTSWQAEQDTIAIRPCSDIIVNAQGAASWNCTVHCRFATESPDFSACHVKEIVDIDQAVRRLVNFN